MKTKTTLIDVPRAGANIHSLELYPQKPKKGVATEWKLLDVSGRKPQTCCDFLINFDVHSSADEQEFEQAVLVIHMGNNDINGEWRFVSGGILYVEGKEDIHHDITNTVSPDGKTLTLAIHNIGPTHETVDFRFVAMRLNKTSGRCKIYASEDPGIRIGRPPAP